ncbi:MAG: D-2-hydroxyacid dehydrogenase [Chloroflexi bacterium]|nr:D-2-hydroxyacid dehydrogenase [Chloroflexota bacterium]
MLKSVNVLVGWGMPSALLQTIAEADHRVRLLNPLDGSVPAPPLPAPPFLFPDELRPLFQEADALLTSRLPRSIPITQAPRLKWVQLISAGADVAMTSELQARRDIVVTTAAGMAADVIAEFVIAGILALAKGFLPALRGQVARRWSRYVPEHAAGKTVGIVGMGRVGERVARLCKALEMRVLATRRSVTAPQELSGLADLLLPSADLPRLLAESDYLVLSLPHTAESHHLIGEQELAMMKPGACLINVARGGVVDEEALVRALRQGRIAGAVLDVFEQEPLSSASPLWRMPNVLITPHIAGAMPDYQERAVKVFLDNLGRYLDGRPLLNIYDPDRGY